MQYQLGRASGITGSYPCNCSGPQPGQPLCPCRMRGVIAREGRWVQIERDLGPAMPLPLPLPPNILGTSRGCVCPPTSEKTCRSSNCPRQPAKPIQVTCAATPDAQP